MSLTGFQNIYDLLLRDSELERSKLDACLRYIDSLESNQFAYVENLVENCGVNENEGLNLLTLLAREEIVYKVYKLYCPLCNLFNDDFFNSLNELDDVEVCAKCGREFHDDLVSDPLKYLAILFKKK